MKFLAVFRNITGLIFFFYFLNRKKSIKRILY